MLTSEEEDALVEWCFWKCEQGHGVSLVKTRVPHGHSASSRIDLDFVRWVKCLL